MNLFVGMGRLTKDPEYSVSKGGVALCRFTLAINRDNSRNSETDYISCVAFGKSADAIKKYLSKGDPLIVSAGRIQTGSYKNKDGQTVYTTNVVVERFNFAPYRKSSSGGQAQEVAANDEDFLDIPEGENLEVPFN